MGLRHIWQAESSQPLGSIGDLDIQQKISTDLLATFVRCISRRLLGCLADHVSQCVAPFFLVATQVLPMAVEVKVFSQLGAFGKKIRLKKAPENRFTSYHKHPWVFLELIAFLLWTLNIFEPGFWICSPLIPRFRRQTMTQNFSMFGYATPMEPLLTICSQGLGREQPGVKRNGATQNRIGEH